METLESNAPSNPAESSELQVIDPEKVDKISVEVQEQESSSESAASPVEVTKTLDKQNPGILMQESVLPGLAAPAPGAIFTSLERPAEFLSTAALSSSSAPSSSFLAVPSQLLTSSEATKTEDHGQGQKLDGPTPEIETCAASSQLLTVSADSDKPAGGAKDESGKLLQQQQEEEWPALTPNRQSALVSNSDSVAAQAPLQKAFSDVASSPIRRRLTSSVNDGAGGSQGKKRRRADTGKENVNPWALPPGQSVWGAGKD